VSDKKNKKKNWTHFLGSEIEQGGDDAFFQILPVPLELSTSYGEGTVLGPFHILDASWQLEMFDGKTRPCDLGIHTHSAIECTGKSEQIQARIERVWQKY